VVPHRVVHVEAHRFLIIDQVLVVGKGDHERVIEHLEDVPGVRAVGIDGYQTADYASDLRKARKVVHLLADDVYVHRVLGGPGGHLDAQSVERTAGYGEHASLGTYGLAPIIAGIGPEQHRHRGDQEDRHHGDGGHD